MQGVTLVDTAVLQNLIDKVGEMQELVMNQKPDRYVSSKEAAVIMGFSEVWVCKNKALIGFSTIGTAIRFKLSDIEKFMADNYFKIQTKRRGKA